MTVKFRTTRRAALAGASALALAGGRARAQAQAPKKGGTLTFMQNSEPQTLVALIGRASCRERVYHPV